MQRAPVFISLLLAACTTGGSEPEITADHLLTGSWVWTLSRGGIAGLERSPESEGYTVRLDYEGDRVRAFRADRLVGESRFTLREDSLQLGPMPVYHVKYTPALHAFAFTTLDELSARITGKMIVEFDEGCCDLYVHSFQKPGVR
jgi:hypothetical protein